jgi:xanthine dehydrogenase accessory factor
MRELLPDLDNWLASGKRIALATVISTWGSAPRPVGSFMAVTAQGEIAGSVSGGCVEGAVVDAAMKVLDGAKAELLQFGVADETAWDVGLACGGKIDVFVQALDTDAGKLAISLIAKDSQFHFTSVIGGSHELIGAQIISSGSEILYHSPNLTANDYDLGNVNNLVNDLSVPRQLELADELAVFTTPILPSPTLIMIGGVHIAIALAQIARTLQFKSVIIDPRKAFGSEERFGHADQLIQAYPGKAFESLEITANSAIASLSHDPKIDDPALLAALDSPAFYIGALGSSKTQKKRMKRLAKLSVPEESLKRIRGPIGLDIGALTPEEIALAIMGQVIEAYRA